MDLGWRASERCRGRGLSGRRISLKFNEGGAIPIVIRLTDDGLTDHRRVRGRTRTFAPDPLSDLRVVVTFTRKRIEAQVGGEGEIVLWGSGRSTRESIDVDDVTELAFGNRTIWSLGGNVV